MSFEGLVAFVLGVRVEGIRVGPGALLKHWL